MILSFFDYVFYRATSSKWYKKVAPKNTYISGFGFTNMCELFNIGFLLNVYGTIHKKNISEIELLIIAIPIVIFNIFRLTEKRYVLLCEKYKYESHKKRNGWLVVLYIIITFLLFFISLFWLSGAIH